VGTVTVVWEVLVELRVAVVHGGIMHSVQELNLVRWEMVVILVMEQEAEGVTMGEGVEVMVALVGVDPVIQQEPY
jgi:hypothetical protein